MRRRTRVRFPPPPPRGLGEMPDPQLAKSRGHRGQRWPRLSLFATRPRRDLPPTGGGTRQFLPARPALAETGARAQWSQWRPAGISQRCSEPGAQAPWPGAQRSHHPRAATLDDLGLSIRGASERSRDGLSYETMRNIARGRHSGRISDRRAQGLATALDVPLSRIYEAARVPRPMSTWKWPKRFDRLLPAQRRQVEEFAAALLDAYDRGVRDGTARPPSTRTPGSTGRAR
jgi:hypothetical protein